jgi:hypothetical protein
MTDHPNRIANLLNVTSTPMAGRLRYRLFEPAGARASVPRNYRYFNEALIEVNLVFSFVPRPFTTAVIASAIPAAINPHSIAVAPDWSAQNQPTMNPQHRRMPPGPCRA